LGFVAKAIMKIQRFLVDLPDPSILAGL